MAQTSLNIRMDSDLKKDFAKLCDEIGMSMSTAFCVFAKAAVRKQGIPFEVTTLDENGFTPEEAAEILRAVEDVKAGRNVVIQTLEEWRNMER